MKGGLVMRRHPSLALPVVAAMLATAALLAATALEAAVPHDDAVPAYAEEQTILQIEKDQPQPGWFSSASGRQHMDRNYIVPPGLMPAQNVILQRGGNTWRTLRNGPLAMLAGTLLLAVPLLFLLVWKFVGPAQTPPPTGRDLPRFSSRQRHLHWATAISFILLALSGIVMLFGKQLLLPWMGHTAFSWLAAGSKYLHNFVGPVFILCSIALFFAFLKRNFFRRLDWQWFRNLGGLRGHARAGFFNPGEKLWFWLGLTLLGLLMSVTGLILNFPYFGDVGTVSGTTRYQQQWANVLHLLGATFYIAAAIGHTYLGTVGVPGTYRGMRHGTVDESWARKHHEAWYEEVVGAPVGVTSDNRSPDARRPRRGPPQPRPDLGLRPTE
jgi:formate dehydrogenase subunit gamma